MTEQELTEKIIKNAEHEAAELIAAAQRKADSQIALAKTAAQERKETALLQAKNNRKQQELQLKKANEVAAIKAEINAKQAIIDQAFQQVRSNLLKAKEPEIKKMVTALVAKYGAPKDTILVSSQWAKALPNYKSTKEIEGGIIIENKTYRIELSLDVLLNELRNRIEFNVAQILGVI